MSQVALLPKTGIEEYDDNPLISRLPLPVTMKEMYGALKRYPECRDAERLLAPHLRQHLVVIRLRKLFIPTAVQVGYANQLGALIRAGYDGVDLRDGSHVARLNDFIDQVEQGASLNNVVRRFAPTALCGSLVGPAGMGKTTIVNATLACLPQVIEHREPATLQQLVYIRLECPSTGSPKQLCLAFFQEVDRVLKTTDYYKRFSGVAADHLMLRVAHVAQLHRLGMLFVDEIQFLNDAHIGEREVLNFLTTLVNVINVPVMLIGTTAAMKLLTTDFRNARRSDGVGSCVLDRMKDDAAWFRFLTELFRFQWTTERTELTPELATSLWHASQGIIDIVMKIFMIAQIRLMRVSESRKHRELVTKNLIVKIMKEDLRIVAPMLRALGSKSTKANARLDDLRPLHEAFENILGAHVIGGELELLDERPVQLTHSAPLGDLDATFVRTLTDMGYGDDAAALVIAEARRRVPSGDPLELFAAISLVVRGEVAGQRISS